ncbi:hypothetical protein [uncultured Pseudokineococcus sp.]|uniref:hypothetical protein n=1 Tax=uncultured Pseudokineococcus sp. TaxID=1642928 RepID=UPI002632C40F|nr:hypothetical protein [uncultured Pseudokineococcus sp.]
MVAVAGLAGAVAWGLAVASTGAARAAEAEAVRVGAPPGADPSVVDAPGTVDLLLHDVRLGALVAVLGALALVRGSSRTRAAGWGGGAGLVGAAAALLVGNAVLGRLLVGSRPPGDGAVAVALGATGLLLLAAAGAVLGGAVARRRRSVPVARHEDEDRGTEGSVPWLEQEVWPASTRWATARLVTAGACAGTAGALGVLGVGTLGQPLHVPGAVAAATLAAASLTALAVAGVLACTAALRRGRWLLAVLAAVPGLLAVVALLVDDVVDRVVVPPLVLLLLPGGFVSMVLTAPAGAVLGVDGLPLVGGGTALGALVGLVAAALLLTRGEPAAPAVGTGPDSAADLA